MHRNRAKLENFQFPFGPQLGQARTFPLGLIGVHQCNNTLVNDIIKGFISDFIATFWSESSESFSSVLNDCVSFLRIAMETVPSKSEFVSRPITALCELVNFTIPGQKVRPIANLIVQRPDWFVSETKTALTANETAANAGIILK